jgi:two-component system chemotaxis response regulator CheB
MQDRSNFKVVVCGASAGGVEALSGLFKALPAELPAAFLVVLHIPAHAQSELGRVLSRATTMPITMPKDGAAIEPGHIYVASPDRHLLVENGRIRVTRGPKECRMRPAVDVLFRSAAMAYGNRAIGVVLSGALDDGTAGLWAIKDSYGLALVQDPSEASFGSMPQRAIDHVRVDLVGRVAALAMKIQASVHDHPQDGPASVGARHAVENLIAAEGNGLQAGVMNLGKVSKYTCPDCHGVLVQIEEGSITRFRCHTGHAFSLQTLLAEVNESIDTGLWDTLRAIEERVMLLEQTAGLAEAAGRADDAHRCRSQAEEAKRRLKPIRELVLDSKFFGHAD